jgi:hypothetical protein
MPRPRTIADKSRLRTPERRTLTRLAREGADRAEMERILARTQKGRKTLAAVQAADIRDEKIEREEDLRVGYAELQEAATDKELSLEDLGIRPIGDQKRESQPGLDPANAETPSALMNIRPAQLSRLMRALTADESDQHEAVVTALRSSARGKQLLDEITLSHVDIIDYVRNLVEFCSRRP